MLFKADNFPLTDVNLATMSTFARTFPIDRINDQVLEENPWFKDMLLDWRPAGDALHRDMTEAHELDSSDRMLEEAPNRLRLAIRNGYLNLYRGGQSVARIAFGAGGLQAKIHNKYVYGNKGSGQSYVILTSGGLRDQETSELRAYGGPDELRRWVNHANAHTGKEKQFVDLVVARNPDTIDLEMGLPAYPQERIAPRMDLVTLEPDGDHWRIVFWEAKLVKNAEARCRGDGIDPKVVRQLKQYTDWLDHPNHRELVAAAYQNTCRLLVKFHGLAKRMKPGIEALGPGIITAAAENAPPLLVDDKPRLLIDDRTSNRAFTKHGHLDKLRNGVAGANGSHPG